MVLRSNFALLLTIQFASLISSLINIISVLLTTLEFFIFGGSLLGRIQGDREPVSLMNIISLDVTSFNLAVMLKLKCGKVVCVEFFIFGYRSSVAYRATENLSRYFQYCFAVMDLTLYLFLFFFFYIMCTSKSQWFWFMFVDYLVKSFTGYFTLLIDLLKRISVISSGTIDLTLISGM